MNRQNNRVVVGTVIIVFGVLALIDNLHLFGMRDVFSFWPAVFILVGVLKISQTRTRSGTTFGVIMIAIGGLLTLEHLGLIYFSFRDLWPLLLIGLGVLVMSKGWVEKEFGTRIGATVLHRGSTANDGSGGNSDGADGNSTINVVSIMSGNKLRKDSQDFRGGEVTAIMGGVEIDLRQASIQGEAVLNVFATWGSIELKVPADWTVISNAIPVMGGIDDRTVPPPVMGKRLILEGYVVMGGVEVRN